MHKTKNKRLMSYFCKVLPLSHCKVLRLFSDVTKCGRIVGEEIVLYIVVPKNFHLVVANSWDCYFIDLRKERDVNGP